MKKLISISVILVLLASAVFAADVSVDVHGGVTLGKGSNEEKLDYTKDDGTPVFTTKDFVRTSYGLSRLRISASGQLEDGTIGGWLRVEPSNWGFNEEELMAGNIGKGFNFSSGWSGFVWWKPSDLIKLQIGSNGGDGEFGIDGVTRWGFHQIAGDVGVANAGNAWGGGTEANAAGTTFGNAFYGGWNAPGIILTVTPVEALTINLAFPINGGIAYKEYKLFTAQVKYNIDGVGTAALTWENSSFEDNGILGTPNNKTPYLRAYFGLTSIENLGIDFGIGYKLPDTEEANKVKTTINNPLNIGVGAHFTSGSLGVKARILAEVLQSVVTESSYDDAPDTLTLNNQGWGMIIDVMPYFAINDHMTFYFNAGLGVRTGWQSAEADGKSWKIETDDSSDFAWHINPYIHISPSYWSGTFFAGFRLDSPHDKYNTWNKDSEITKNRKLDWSIPIGISIGF